MNPDLRGAVWRKSSYSGGNGGACIELAYVGGYAGVRDSKHTAGDAIVIPEPRLAAFLASVKSGHFDR